MIDFRYGTLISKDLLESTSRYGLPADCQLILSAKKRHAFVLLGRA